MTCKVYYAVNLALFWMSFMVMLLMLGAFSMMTYSPVVREGNVV